MNVGFEGVTLFQRVRNFIEIYPQEYLISVFLISVAKAECIFHELIVKQRVSVVYLVSGKV